MSFDFFSASSLFILWDYIQEKAHLILKRNIECLKLQQTFFLFYDRVKSMLSLFA